MKGKQFAILVVLLMSGAGISRVAFAQEPNATRESASEKQVIARERAIWDALKNKDYASFDRTVAGATNVDAGGMMISKPHDLKPT